MNDLFTLRSILLIEGMRGTLGPIGPALLLINGFIDDVRNPLVHGLKASLADPIAATLAGMRDELHFTLTSEKLRKFASFSEAYPIGDHIGHTDAQTQGETAPKNFLLSSVAVLDYLLHASQDELDAIAGALNDRREAKNLVDALSPRVKRTADRWAGLDPDLQALSTAAGPLLTTHAVRERLDVSRQAVSEAVKAHRLIAVRVGAGLRYPAIQFTNTEILPGLPSLLRALGKIKGWDALRILMALDAPEDERPMALLKAGDKKTALAALLARRAEWADAAFDQSDRADRIAASLDRDLDAETGGGP